MQSKFVKRALGLIIAAVIVLWVAWFLSGAMVSAGPKHYIAHGGGAIDGQPITNSLEAVEHSIANGIKFIELDLQMTSDNKLVAAHDWGTFRELTGGGADDTQVPSLAEFCNKRIMGKYRPLTYLLIDSLFKANPDLWLVTDKITDVNPIEAFLPDIKERIIVECFTPEQYDECRKRGLRGFRSYHNLTPGGINAVERHSRRMVYQHFIPTEFAVYSRSRISTAEADSIFKSDKRIRFIYVDYIQDNHDIKK
ncbi:MAG: hypothetical protein HDS11_06880 [Bacteroides sp.]|nr:hypothetical protein [Bacteroides sp.]